MFPSNFVIIAVILLIGTTNCSNCSTGNSSCQGVKRIYGGTGVHIQNYPYQISLRILNRHHCGGSIISERHILTAAHCIDKYTTSPPFSYVRVVTGTSYTNRPGNVHRISNIDVHPGWKDEAVVEDLPYPHDLAVITLQDTIVFDEYQQKIELPSHDFEEGQEANVTGWGLTSQDPEIRPRQLQLLKTKLVSQDVCQKEMSNPEKMKIYDTHVCAFRSRGKGPCYGDSGGPLAANGQVIGVVSWLDGDFCAVGTPEVYTNVYKYIDYIQNIMNSS